MQIKWANLAILAGCIVLLLHLTKYRAALRSSCNAFMLLFGRDGEELFAGLIVIIVIVIFTSLLRMFFGQ